MPHPVFGKPTHSLETVEVRLVLPSRHNDYRTSMRAWGRSSGQRTHLWTTGESWSAEDVTHGLQPGDSVHHVVLTALQDRPASQQALEFALGGAGWEDVPLPF